MLYLMCSRYFRRVTETKLLPVIGRFGVPSGVTSEGTLVKHDTWSVESDMSVSWNTGLLRSDQLMVSSMKYVIMDTDYTTRALVCQCQDINLAFVNANRRTCEYLIVSENDFLCLDFIRTISFQRPNMSLPYFVPSDYKTLLDSVSPDLALDMKRVRQDDCDQLDTRPTFDVGLWWSMARDYGQTLASMAAGWF